MESMPIPLTAGPKILGRPRAARTASAEETTPALDAVVTARCRGLFRLLAVVLLGLHIWAAPVEPPAAGRPYLEAAAAYRNDEIGTALQSCRGPLTAWLLAGVLAVARTEAAPVLRILTGVLFLAVLAAFEWLLFELLRLRRAATADARARWQEVVPDALVVGLAYAFFILAARYLLPGTPATPHLLATALVPATAALLLRLRRLGATPVRSMLLGTLLGGAYLAEPVLLPILLVFLGLSLPGKVSEALRHLAWSLFALGALTAPFAVALARIAGPMALLERTVPQAVLRFDLGQRTAAAMFLTDVLGGRMLCFTGSLAVLFGYAFFSRRGPLSGWLGEQYHLLWAQRTLLLPAAAGLGLSLLLGWSDGGFLVPFLILAALALPETLRFRQPQLVHVRPLGAALLTCLTVVLLAAVLRDAHALTRHLAG
jgi:hypothetical protein